MYYPSYSSYNKTPQQTNKNSNVLVDVTPFAPIILKATYTKFNPKIMEFCERVTAEVKPKTDTQWSTHDGKSTEDNIPHLHPAFKEYYDWMNPIAMDIITNKFGYDKNMGYAIMNSWINLHRPGGSTESHHHGPSVLSVATYLYMPPNGGWIEFKDPLEYCKGYFPTTADDEILNWKAVPTKTGDVVMFPGWLRHRTQENKSNENRWVITTNYICTNMPKGMR